jgi:hypothetical protein
VRHYKSPVLHPITLLSKNTIASLSMEPTERSHSTTATTAASLTLAQAHFDELAANVRGEVYRRGDGQYVTASNLGFLTVVPHFLCPPPSFQEHTRLFNGNVLNTSRAVVLPLDAHDVSQYATLLTCALIPADILPG